MTGDNSNLLIELAAKIGQEQPQADPAAISKVLVKLVKLAKTIRNRESVNGGLHPNSQEAFDKNTDQFFRKACDLAKSINCEFSAGSQGAAPLDEFYLRLEQGITRIL